MYACMYVSYVIFVLCYSVYSSYLKWAIDNKRIILGPNQFGIDEAGLLIDWLLSNTTARTVD